MEFAQELADGKIEFALPVLFADPSNVPDALPTVDDEEGVDGLKRLAPNLYQLTGDGSTADMVCLPLPLQSAEDKPPRTQLTIGFLHPNIRLPCLTFQNKAKHSSFLGCDVLISSEWGQGISSALSAPDRLFMDAIGDVGTYDVAELVAMSRARYHLAPGPLVPVADGDAPAPMQSRFLASLPYAYPPTSSQSAHSKGSHAGRFLALGSVTDPTKAKQLGKAYKFMHALGITPLAYMNSAEREAAKEESVAVNCPYTDESYQVDNTTNNGFAKGGSATTNPGGMSEAQARRIAQQDAAATMSASSNTFRWQHQSRKRGRDGDPRQKEEEARQAYEQNNPSNLSLFLHGLHRDPGGVLSEQVLMDAFRPFGCTGVRFPRARQMGQSVSFVFLDFGSHEEAGRCLADLKGEVVIR